MSILLILTMVKITIVFIFWVPQKIRVFEKKNIFNTKFIKFIIICYLCYLCRKLLRILKKI